MHCNDEQCFVCMHELAKKIISDVGEDPRDNLRIKVCICNIFKHHFCYYYYKQFKIKIKRVLQSQNLLKKTKKALKEYNMKKEEYWSSLAKPKSIQTPIAIEPE